MTIGIGESVMGEVQRKSLLTVVPGKITPPGKVYPLSNLDHMMRLHTLKLVYYYQSPLEDMPSSQEKVATLRASLSRTLSSYPAVCGRLVPRQQDGNWEIKCNDAGVRVMEAKANVTLRHWIETANRSDELSLCHDEPIGPDPFICSLLVVQFTEFEDGGIAIGLSCNHMLGDPSCLTLFMKAWGETHRRAQVLHPPFFHPPGLKARLGKNDTTTATKYYESTFRSEPTPLAAEYRTVVFKVGEESLKDLVSDDFTPFDVLAPVFWAACCRSKGVETCELSLCTEFRKIIISPLPHGFFGNALHFSEVSATAEEMAMAGKDMSVLARRIKDQVDALEREELRSVMEWLEANKGTDGHLPPPFYLYGPQLTAVNGERFFTYDAVFDEEKPLHVSYHVEPAHGQGVIFVTPSAESPLGRTVSVTVPAGEAAALCADPLLLRLSPTPFMK